VGVLVAVDLSVLDAYICKLLDGRRGLVAFEKRSTPSHFLDWR
jgi:hypothetical protein